MFEEQVNAAARFTVIIEGPAVSQTYPLLAVTSILLNTTAILRDSAMDIISPTVEELHIEVDAGFPRPGSYVQDVVLKVVEFVSDRAAPIIQAVPITDIVKHANETLSLAERFRKFWRQNKNVHVDRVENGEAIVVGDGNGELPIPEKSLKDLEATVKILSELDHNRLRSVKIRTDSSEVKIEYESPSPPLSNDEGRRMNTTLRRLSRETKHGGAAMIAAAPVAALPPAEQPTVTLGGQIRELDLDSRTGRIRVIRGDSVPHATYTFELVGEQSLIDLKNLLGESTVIVDCIVQGRGRSRRLMILSLRRAG